MSCCSSGAALLMLMPPDPQVAALDVLLASRPTGDLLRHSELWVPGIACDGCAEIIAAMIGELGGVESCAVDVAAKRVSVDWLGEPPPLVAALREAGYESCPIDLTAELVRPAGQFRFDRNWLGLGWLSRWSARAWGV